MTINRCAMSCTEYVVGFIGLRQAVVQYLRSKSRSSLNCIYYEKSVFFFHYFFTDWYPNILDGEF